MAKIIAGGVVAILAVIGFALGWPVGHADSAPAIPAVMKPPAVGDRPVEPPCSRSAPSTAAGYAALFAALPTNQWGAADVAISVALADGRSVWLFGDTFSAGSFVHSTAIVQRRGCLHVAQAGAQLLPNDDSRHIYWISSATATGPGTITVTARAIRLTGSCSWCFADGGFSRTATLPVTPAGDLTFHGWGPKRPGPAPDPGPLYHVDSRPHHVGYARHSHPELRLASGRTLVTTCQNFDDGILHPFADYRPIFTEL